MSNKPSEAFKARLRSGEIEIDYQGHNRTEVGELANLKSGDQFNKSYIIDKIMGDFIFWIDIDCNYKYPDDVEKESTMQRVLKYIPENFAQDIIDGNEFDWTPLNPSGSGASECFICGERYHYETNGLIVRVIGIPAIEKSSGKKFTTCEYPGGIKEFSVEIDVPSGRLVFANNLTEYFTQDEDYYINETIGIKNSSDDYGRQGMIHFYVGNTCPGVYRDGDNLKIGSTWVYDEDPEKEHELDWGDSVASICTDLWWFSAVDYNRILDLMVKAGRSREEIEKEFKDHCDVVEVKPGKYKATSYYQHNGDKDNLYSRIELVVD